MCFLLTIFLYHELLSHWSHMFRYPTKVLQKYMVSFTCSKLSVMFLMLSHMHLFRGEGGLIIYCCKKSILLYLIENSNWLSLITKKGKIESASWSPCGFWMSDDKQLEI
jgi:hypothetical protein